MLSRYMLICVLYVCVHLTNGDNAIKVLENTVGPETFNIVGGATLVEDDVVTDTSLILEGFAICARFKLKIIGAPVTNSIERLP